MMKQVNIRIPVRILALMMGLFLSLGAFAQINVRGHVKDSSGEPIIGATIRIAGQSAGVVSDFDGNFTLQAQQGAMLEVSYVGYQTARVNAASSVVITLQEDAQTLENVVVIGYGRAKKSDLTGSVTAIKPDAENHGLITSAQEALQGKVAGVNITTDGGKPGAGATIRIRGGSSLNASNDPLIVIDGLAMDSYSPMGTDNALAMVNPNDIESFTILKDASATAIYGSRASNGVIIITTKKGRKGSKPAFSYNGNVSVGVVKKTMDVMDGPEFTAFAEKLTKRYKGYSTEEWLESPEYANLGYYDKNGRHLFANTDWQDQIYRTSVSTDHNITLTGGLKNMPYRVSLGYTEQEGVLKTSDYERLTASVSLSPSLLDDHLNFNINGKASYSKTYWADMGAIGNAIGMDPTKPVYATTAQQAKDYNGYWQWSYPTVRPDAEWTNGVNNTAVGNPVATLENARSTGKNRIFVGNIEADYKIHGFEDLHLHMNAGAELNYGNTSFTNSPYSYSTGNYYYGRTGWGDRDTYNLSFNAYAQYMKDFTDAHHFDIMAGYEWQHFHQKYKDFSTGYYPMTNTEQPGQQYLPTETKPYKGENYIVSFFGRMNYTLLERYMLTFTLRDDGSSRFSKNNRWGLFPSLALAWKINEEPFLKKANWMSDLKLRLGWGKTGQQEGIGDFTYIATYKPNVQGAYYNLFGDGRTYRPDAFNENLTWEKTTTWNAGIDFGILNNRITANIDWYYRKTTDLLNDVVIPVGINFANKVKSNIGELHNTGIEVALNWRAIQTKDWNWQLGYNITWNESEIDKLTSANNPEYKILHGGYAGGDGTTNGIKAYMVGHPVEAFYTYQQVYDVNGQPVNGQFVDASGNGVFDEKDRYFYKKSTPDVTMGFTSKLNYKSWDLGFSMRASINNYVYNGVQAGTASNLNITQVYNGSTWHNVMNDVVAKQWYSLIANESLSDYFVQNASFLKLDNITLGYSFTHLWDSSISGRVYATAQNVLTITKYKGLDPEIDGGYDGNIYPRPFVGILGVNLNF